MTNGVIGRHLAVPPGVGSNGRNGKVVQLERASVEDGHATSDVEISRCDNWNGNGLVSVLLRLVSGHVVVLSRLGDLAASLGKIFAKIDRLTSGAVHGSSNDRRHDGENGEDGGELHVDDELMCYCCLLCCLLLDENWEQRKPTGFYRFRIELEMLSQTRSAASPYR